MDMRGELVPSFGIRALNHHVCVFPVQVAPSYGGPEGPSTTTFQKINISVKPAC